MFLFIRKGNNYLSRGANSSLFVFCFLFVCLFFFCVFFFFFFFFFFLFFVFCVFYFCFVVVVVVVVCFLFLFFFFFFFFFFFILFSKREKLSSDREQSLSFKSRPLFRKGFPGYFYLYSLRAGGINRKS